MNQMQNPFDFMGGAFTLNSLLMNLCSKKKAQNFCLFQPLDVTSLGN